MKNEKLKSLMVKKITEGTSDPMSGAEILNKAELLFAIGGLRAPVDCPNLTSCGTYSDCNGKCGAKVSF